MAVLLCRAWTILHGLPGTLQGLQLRRPAGAPLGACPPLPEDGDDYFMRMNALGTLSDVTGFVRDLRNADFLRGALGQISVRDAELMARGNVPEDLPHLTADELRMASARAHAEGHETLLAVTPRCRNSTGSAPAANSTCPATSSPSSTACASCCWPSVNGCPSPQATPTRPLKPIRPHRPAPGRPGIPARARHPTPRHATANRRLPSCWKSPPSWSAPSPPTPPLLIRRAARFMRMGFMDILRELSPDSLAQVEVITGAHLQEQQT